MKIIKTIVSILSLFFSINLFAQTTELEKCGLDNNSILNQSEANYFNSVFLERKGEFDFTGKVVAYYSGSSGNVKSDKSNYFYGVKNSTKEDIHTWQAGGTQILILTEEEKALSGGYDVILVSWSKFFKSGKSRKGLVKRLKNAAKIN